MTVVCCALVGFCACRPTPAPDKTAAASPPVGQVVPVTPNPPAPPPPARASDLPAPPPGPPPAPAADAPMAPIATPKTAARKPAPKPAAATATTASPPKAAPAPTTATAQPAAPPAAQTAVGVKPAAPALDLASLEQRLRDTKAIGVFTKLSLKNQVDDLLDEVRQYHRNPSNPPQPVVRQQFEGLMLKVLSSLQGGDPQLANTIAASREALWGILMDPEKFSKI